MIRRTSLIAIVAFLYAAVVQAEVVLKDIQGAKIPFSQLKGKWVMINYWSSWCQPCLDEVKTLNAFYKAHQGKVALFAVNFDGLPLKEQKVLIKKAGIRFPSLATNPRRQLGLEELRGVPATFVFDPNGRLRKTLYGEQSMGSLNRAIR